MSGPSSEASLASRVWDLAGLLASPGQSWCFLLLLSLPSYQLQLAVQRARDLLGIPVSLDKMQNDLFKHKPQKTATGPQGERCSLSS